MPFGIGPGRRTKQEEWEHAFKEVNFWKAQLDKAVLDKNEWMSKCAASNRQVKILHAEVEALQQGEAGALAQLEVCRKQLADARRAAVADKSQPPPSGTASSQAVAQAVATASPSKASSRTAAWVQQQQQQLQRSLYAPSSREASPPRSPTKQQQQQQQQFSQQHKPQSQQVAISAQESHIVASLRAQQRDSELKALLLEDRAESFIAEVERLRSQLGLLQATSDAHRQEADMLRRQLVAQSGLNEETADEMTKVLAEVGGLRQANARYAAELASKDDMMALLEQQLVDWGSAQCACCGATGMWGQPQRLTRETLSAGGASASAQEEGGRGATPGEQQRALALDSCVEEEQAADGHTEQAATLDEVHSCYRSACDAVQDLEAASQSASQLQDLEAASQSASQLQAVLLLDRLLSDPAVAKQVHHLLAGAAAAALPPQCGEAYAEDPGVEPPQEDGALVAGPGTPPGSVADGGSALHGAPSDEQASSTSWDTLTA